jgi:phosphoglycerate kinase
MKTLREIPLRNKVVLVRCDFNVPIFKGKIEDDYRIRATIPTIKFLTRKGAKTVLLSHLDEPPPFFSQKKFEPKEIKKYSLEPVAGRLSRLLEKKVKFVKNCLGEEVETEIKKLKRGEVLLLENLRFYEEEKSADEKFAKRLASLAQVYLNDAFGTCHRAHASVYLLPRYLPSGAGLLLEKETKILSQIFKKPRRPLVGIIGGIKIESKIKVIKNFLEKGDRLLFGGKMAEAILKIKKGESLSLGKETEKEVRDIDLKNEKIILPQDFVVSFKGKKRIAFFDEIKKGEEIEDIGPKTIEIFSQTIKKAKTIFWSGPLGKYEDKNFEKGTKEIGKTITKNRSAFKIAGGGDTDSALLKFGLRKKFDFISTGGGAMLSFLSGEKLPGLEALDYYGD